MRVLKDILPVGEFESDMNQSTDIKSAVRNAEFICSAPIFCKFFRKTLAVSKKLCRFAMFKNLMRCKNRRNFGFFYVYRFDKIIGTKSEVAEMPSRICIKFLNTLIVLFLFTF